MIKFHLTEIMRNNLLQPLRKSRTFKILCFNSSAGIFLAKEPKATQPSVLLHINTTKCYGLVMLGIDLESTQITGKIHGFVTVSATPVDGMHSIKYRRLDLRGIVPASSHTGQFLYKSLCCGA